MSKRDSPILIKLKRDTYDAYFIYSEKDKCFVPLDESRLSKEIPGYTSLNEQARKRKLDSFIKDSEVIRKFKCPSRLPNAPQKPDFDRLSSEERAAAAKALLSIGTIFESPKSGYMLLADITCGLHCTSLCRVEPTFSPTIAVRSDSPEILLALKRLAKASVCISRWKGGKKVRIHRKAVLDYRIKPGEFPRHIQDFSQVTCSVSGYKKLCFPMPYSDTVVLLIGADSSQVREAMPYINNAAVLLLNSGTGDLTPTKLSSADIAAYDPGIVSQLKDKRKYVAALLDWWWMPYEDEDAWARWIVQEARASFGKPDSRYIRVELDPRKLRDAIRYRVLLSFLDELEAAQILTAEELEPYRTGAREVFDPAPKVDKPPRRAEDPEVFLEIMRELVQCASIVPEGERYVKSSKALGAWRTISNKSHLVMLEEVWAREYKKEAKKRKDMDVSCFQREHWERDMQKHLVKHEMIKPASSGYRYRYDLMEAGDRDTTYVVAIPTALLEN